MIKRLFFGLCLIFLCSCSSDNDNPLSDELVNNPVIGVYDEENRWIYGQMNHYYLWREQLPDSLACDYTTDPVTFYKTLLSPEDRFSYCKRNTDYTGNIEKTDYGFAYQEYQTGDNKRFLQVLYVTSKELKQTLSRGEWLREIQTQEEVLTFEKGTWIEGKFHPEGCISINTKKWDSYQNTVYIDSIYTINNRKVGYLCYLEFNAVADLENSMRKFYENSIDELVLDLRYNPGGYVRTCCYLCNSIIPENGYGQIFQQCSYNDRVTAEYKETTGKGLTIEYYETPNNGQSSYIGSSMYGLKLKRIYILTSSYTASASEATIICLKPYMDVVLIGEQTYGKGVGSWTISDKKYKYELQPIIFRYHNAMMETTPDKGIPVDKIIPGGYETTKMELGDINEPLLSAAFSHIRTGDFSDNTLNKEQIQTKNVGLSPIGFPSFFKNK